VKPAVHDTSIYRGDTYELFFRVRTQVWNPLLNGGAGGLEPGPYRDLTGFTGAAQFRSSPDAVDPPELIFTVTIVDQLVTLGGVLVYASPAQTAAIAISAGVYDVQLSDGVDKWTYIKGAVAVDPDVTRP
jgi:hypothetical protein